MIKLIVSMATALLVSGCAATYFFEGKKYENQEKFQQAVNDARDLAVQGITPLKESVTNKRLIAVIPSEQAFKEEMTRRVTMADGRAPMGIAIEQIENLSKSSYKMTRVWYDGIQRRKIFRDIEIRENPSMVASIEPSSEYDVMFYTEPGIGAGQFFYSSVKHGKQAFAFDRSGTDVTQRVRSFVDAVSALAIRD